jgi:hypothetical protein
VPPVRDGNFWESAVGWLKAIELQLIVSSVAGRRFGAVIGHAQLD